MSIRIILELMIKFKLPIAVFIAVVFGVSYFWNNSSAQGRKRIALVLLAAVLLSLVLTIYLIID